MQIDLDLFDSLLDLVETAASTAGGRNNLSKWIETNTSDPLNPRKPWSFKDHEFQYDIVNSKHPQTYIRKASQIGVSEIMVRIVMALLAKIPGRHAIYTLPDAGFARKFAGSRFDPVIAASTRLQKLIDKDLNNNEIKKFASSYLYISGSQKESQSISVPASMLFFDEVAYSNQEVLGTYHSRLGHLKQGEEIVYGFSTPLLPNSDIDALFQSGTADEYMCYHDKCNQWVVLDPLLHIRIPDCPSPFELITKEDVNKIDPSQAYVECPHCKQEITTSNLTDPTRRAWVPAHPDRQNRSFNANFLVLPSSRTPERVIRDRKNYRSTSKWLCFAVGVPAETGDFRFSQEAIDRCFQTTPISPTQASITPPINTVIGMDVGKTGHLIIARKSSQYLEILHTEQPKQDEDNNLALTYAQRYRQYRARQGVIDAMPEITVPTKAQAMTPYNATWAAYFTRGQGKTNLDFIEKKENDGVVMVKRTQAFDLLVEMFNQGKILFPKNSPHEQTIRDHLRQLVRITDLDATGEEKSRWVSQSSEDHFAFALLYAFIAAEMVSSDSSAIILPTSASFASKIRMKL